MVVGEFNASNIAAQEDEREATKKASTIDMAKLTADIAAQKDLAKQPGKLHGAVETLLNLEKSSRLAEDVTATKAACCAVLEVAFEAKDWKLLEENIMLLAKRRAQMKQAIQAFVRLAISYIDQTPDKETRISLIKTLQTVTEGKIFVEIERARLTRKLAALKEAEGNVAEAADILQEVAVETFGAMAKTEKVAFILEQVRLCLDRQDFIRAQILSRKISPKAFVERKGEGKGEIGIEGTAIEAPDDGVPTLPELQLTYYRHLIRYHSHNNNYLEITRSYRAMYETAAVAEGDESVWGPVLKKIVWFLVLSPPYSTANGSASDRDTLIALTQADKRLADLPLYKQLLSTFTTPEVVRWSGFEASFGGEVAAQEDIFTGPGSEKLQADLRLRVTEHNVMVVAKYYSRISTARLAELLDLSLEEAEKQLSDLVVAKAVAAKVDRPAGLVRFGGRPAPETTLNGWANNISKLLNLVDKSCQQIAKEAMVHKVVLTTSA